MSDEVLVRAEGVSKKYCRRLKRSLWYGLKDTTSDMFARRNDACELRPDEFWAVDDVSFELKRGQCLGLIGRNGAGKTTLLKMLNGLIKPDRGRIEVRGRVGALIALGAGFNPILTGRENIYINGAILGLSKKDVDARLDDIVGFADIGAFVDAPVQSYSSGMYVRLGFAIATALKPDVLLVDEVLAVGDASFRMRCYNRIRNILPHTAVILSSHNMTDIARCSNTSCLLDGGRAEFIGDLERAIHLYQSRHPFLAKGNDYEIYKEEHISEVTVDRFNWHTDDLSTRIDLRVAFNATSQLGRARARLVIFDEADVALAEWDSGLLGRYYEVEKGLNRVDVTIENVRLKSGMYRCVFVLTDTTNAGYFFIIEHGIGLRIKNAALGGAAYKLESRA